MGTLLRGEADCGPATMTCDEEEDLEGVESGKDEDEGGECRMREDGGTTPLKFQMKRASPQLMT